MRSSRGSIIDQALQRVGNNTAQLRNAARFRLNRILQELYQGADWPFLWKAIEIVLPTSGVLDLSLIVGFQKPEDTESLMLLSMGGAEYRHIIHEVDHRVYSQSVTSNIGGGLPQIWTINYAFPSGQTYPAPREQAVCLLRYKEIPADFPLTDATAYDADIPTFPWDTTLSDLIFEWAMSYEVDPRRGDQFQVNVDSIARARGASFPERSYPSFVPLDPTIFSTPFRGN